MKCQIPQISWHSRDPVLSIDFQPGQRSILRLASGGTDSHVLIWYLTFNENKSLKIECASDLYRHNKSVNVVRFSPDGETLASGDDEGAIFLWKLKDRDGIEVPKDEENTNKEDWYPYKLLRGHLEDIYDISWSPNGNSLVSASMDNTAIMWDMVKFQKLHIFSDFKGYVQGVTWDPMNQYIASLGSDRALRIHNINSKKTVFRVQKAPWMVTTDKGLNKARLFYDDTLQSYCRRLTFTPDGELLITPSGIVEKGEKFSNTTYVFSRHSLTKPVLQLTAGEKYTIAVRCNPLLYKLRRDEANSSGAKPMIDLPYRMIFAVAACDSILMYDTEQLLPFAYVSNIHYTHLTDLTWSHDGQILVASSTDGYCSFIIFGENELGEVYVTEEQRSPVEDVKNSNSKSPVSESPNDKISSNLEVAENNLKPIPKIVITLDDDDNAEQMTVPDDVAESKSDHKATPSEDAELKNGSNIDEAMECDFTEKSENESVSEQNTDAITKNESVVENENMDSEIVVKRPCLSSETDKNMHDEVQEMECDAEVAELPLANPNEKTFSEDNSTVSNVSIKNEKMENEDTFVFKKPFDIEKPKQEGNDIKRDELSNEPKSTDDAVSDRAADTELKGSSSSVSDIHPEEKVSASVSQESSSDEPETIEKIPPVTVAEKPKRRIQLITLTSKVSDNFTKS